MVNLSQQNASNVREWAEHQIPYLISCWRELPGVYAEIDSWDVGERQSYVEEWPLYETSRKQLEDASREGLLTSEQERGMQTLRALVDQHNDALCDLLRS